MGKAGALARWGVSRPDPGSTLVETRGGIAGLRLPSMSNLFAALARSIHMLVRTPSIEPIGPTPEVPADDLPETVNEETVAAMLDNLRRLVAYEEQRLNSLTTRGVGLAGFAGLATAVLSAVNISGAAPDASKVLVSAAIFGLVVVVAGVVLGMLTARGGTIQSTRQLALYMNTAYQSVAPARVNIQIVDTLIRRLEGLRSQNRSRASWLNRSALALVLSVSFAAMAAVIRFFA